MDKTTSTTIVILVILLALVGMIVGWRGRKKRQAHIAAPETVPEQTGRELFTVEAFYVSTTVADQELNRIAVAGLGFRSRSTVTVTESGIILALDAVPEVFIPASKLRGVDRATYTIDRVVEKGGLIRVGWTLGETDVDSYLRVNEPAESSGLLTAVESIIIPVSATTADPTTDTTPTEGQAK